MKGTEDARRRGRGSANLTGRGRGSTLLPTIMSLQAHEQVVSQAVANRYQNGDKTKMDVMTALHNYRGLLPKMEKFVTLFIYTTFPPLTQRITQFLPLFLVFNDGIERELLNLAGTIPVRFKGAVYNIPVCIWLLDNHPFSPPMVYVKPTPDMLIKASRHVDQNGKVFLPYLHEWNLNSSDLVGLIQIMIMVFNEMPPVYAKPKGHTASATPYPSYPNPMAQVPGYMPMPGVGSNMPYPTPQPPATSGYPPYPTQPAYPPTSTPYPVYPPTSTAGAHTTMPQHGGPYPPPYTAGMPYNPYPPATSNPATQTSATETSTTSATSTGTITEEHIRASLISAVSDCVRAKLRDSYGGCQAEVSVCGSNRQT
ncbi:Tumor susceptibility 101 protein [Chionoecetes opilio]|uniref:Tumor susceptibility 101 protein n=1 Tax=Chionoecetes opilio TaxID=41210 RepID=A0A8J5D0J7_CHIOP|nr:Tumor susceptibility 101 protein [Chionoecetes opilio]